MNSIIILRYCARYFKYIIILIILCVQSEAAIPFLNNIFSDNKKISLENHDQYYTNQIKEVLDIVNKHYIKDLDKDKLLKGALKGMLNTIDSHSSYLVDGDIKELEYLTNGELSGIGITSKFTNRGFLKVISTIADAPADKAGIKTGDYIIAVNGKLLSKTGSTSATEQIKGKAGTKVKITVVREKNHEIQEYELTRELIRVKSIKYHMDNNIAYIKLSSFHQNSFDELVSAVKDLNSNNNILGIILDLRNNPGGLLDQAVLISEYFIDSGLILETKGKTPDSCKSYFADPNSIKAPKVPLIILINSKSASASEALTIALQDHKRAIIIGDRSYGKGSVQTSIKSQYNNAMLKLTTAMYYSPLGRTVHSEGIEPDIRVLEDNSPQTKSALTQLYNKDNDFEEMLYHHISKHYKNKNFDLEKFSKLLNKTDNHTQSQYTHDLKCDNQYLRALDLMKGLVIMNSSVLANKNLEHNFSFN